MNNLVLIPTIGILSLVLSGCISGSGTTDSTTTNNNTTSTTAPSLPTGDTAATSGDVSGIMDSTTNTAQVHSINLCTVAGYDSDTGYIETGVRATIPTQLYEVKPAGGDYAASVLAGKSTIVAKTYDVRYSSGSATGTSIKGYYQNHPVETSYSTLLSMDSALNMFTNSRQGETTTNYDGSTSTVRKVSNTEFKKIHQPDSTRPPIYLMVNTETYSQATTGGYAEANTCMNMLAPVSTAFPTTTISGKNYGSVYMYGDMTSTNPYEAKVITVSGVVAMNTTGNAFTVAANKTNQAILQKNTTTSFTTTGNIPGDLAANITSTSANGTFKFAFTTGDTVEKTGFFSPDGILGGYTTATKTSSGTSCTDSTDSSLTDCRVSGANFLIQLPTETTAPTAKLTLINNNTYYFRGVGMYMNTSGSIGSEEFSGTLQVQFASSSSAPFKATIKTGQSLTNYVSGNIRDGKTQSITNDIPLTVTAGAVPGAYTLTSTDGTFNIHMFLSPNANYILAQVTHKDTNTNDYENTVLLGSTTQ